MHQHTTITHNYTSFNTFHVQPHFFSNVTDIVVFHNTQFLSSILHYFASLSTYPITMYQCLPSLSLSFLLKSLLEGVICCFTPFRSLIYTISTLLLKVCFCFKHFPLLLFSPFCFIPLFLASKEGRINCWTLPAHQIIYKTAIEEFYVIYYPTISIFKNIFPNSDYPKILSNVGRYIRRLLVKV